ncbi:MAG TPA: rod shape-determining protein MreC [Planctomycetota bacterium]|nr:rod shape-determining protein MreC [Planctomycetota bacterium]
MKLKFDLKNMSRRRALLVALAASLLLLVLPAAVSARVRLAAASLFSPITGSVRSVGMGLRLRLAAFGRGTELQQQLEAERQAHAQTRAQLAEAQDQLKSLQRASEEAAGLRRAKERNSWRRGVPVAANVIRRPGRWENCELIVDCGSDQGVEPRQAVLVGESVLGLVAEVSPGTSRVVMLGHPDVIVPAMIVETRQQGIVEVVDGRIELRFITRGDRQVRNGYQIVTSGLDGAFPPGCLIGEVDVAVHAPDQPFYRIFVAPAMAAVSPETVWVITGTAPEGRPGPKRPAEQPAPGGRSGSAGRKPAG